MALKLVKKTAEHKIYKRGDERYAVRDASGKPVNGEAKVAVLLAEGLIKVTEPSAPAEEPVAEEAESDAADGEAAGDAAE